MGNHSSLRSALSAHFDDARLHPACLTSAVPQAAEPQPPSTATIDDDELPVAMDALGEWLWDAIGPHEDLLREALDKHDEQLIEQIIARMDRWMKAGLALGFLDLRRQIKANQRMLTDIKKQQAEESKAQRKALGELEDQVRSLGKQLEEEQVGKKLDRLLERLESQARIAESDRAKGQKPKEHAKRA